MTKYHSQVIKGGDFKGDHLKKTLIAAMEAFKLANHCYPQIIVIYRDGISDG